MQGGGAGRKRWERKTGGGEERRWKELGVRGTRVEGKWIHEGEGGGVISKGK